MRRLRLPFALCLLVVATGEDGHAAQPASSVLEYHGDAARTGNFIVPSLSWNTARGLRPDPNFHPQIAGDVNAQPLYWHPAAGGPDLLIVATESNTIYALDPTSGRTIWRQTIGKPVPRSELPCGNIDPLGITGTPVIEPSRQAVYVAAMREDNQDRPDHAIFALSLRDGSILAGWPMSVAAALRNQGQTFDTANQNQRGALAILDGKLLIPYGGHYGDCASYRGWVVGVDLANPRAVTSWHTEAAGGAIWSPAGISADDKGMYVATGNTMGATHWGGGEAVVRLTPDLKFSGNPKDFFAPSDWQSLDDRDLDLGGVAPMLIDPGKPMALALGKDGKAYLLDRNNLGGIGNGFASQQVSSDRIRGAAAAFPAGEEVFAAFQGRGSNCPRGSSGSGLTVLKLRSSSPAISTAWCAGMDGRGSPIVTTTDGHSDPIVWIPGAEGDNKLYGFRGDTGERLFLSDPLPGLQHFQSLIAVRGHIYIAAKDGLYAFSF